MTTVPAFSGQPTTARDSIVRMMTRILAAGTLFSVALGGAVLSSSDAGQPAAKCKVVSVTSTTETRAYVDQNRTGDPSGIITRTATKTTQKCRGQVSTSTTYGPWSAPHGFTS